MSIRVFCDVCDQQIPDEAQRLTLDAQVTTGELGISEPTHLDFCTACIKGIPVLATLFLEARVKE